MFILGVGLGNYAHMVEAFVYGLYELTLDDIEQPVMIITRTFN